MLYRTLVHYVILLHSASVTPFRAGFGLLTHAWEILIAHVYLGPASNQIVLLTGRGYVCAYGDTVTVTEDRTEVRVGRLAVGHVPAY